MVSTINKKEQDLKTIQNFHIALNQRGKFSSPFKASSEEDMVLLNLYKMAYPLQTLSAQLNMRCETNLYLSLFTQALTDADFLERVLKVKGDTLNYRVELCLDYKKDENGNYLFKDGLLKPNSNNKTAIRAVESFREIWKACNETQKQTILKKECSMFFQSDYVFVKNSLEKYLLSSMDDGFTPCKTWDDFLSRSSENQIKYQILSEDNIQRFIPKLEKKFGFSASKIFSSSAYDSSNGFSLFQMISRKSCCDLNFKEQNLLDNVKLEFAELVENGVPPYPFGRDVVEKKDSEIAHQFNLYENIERWINVRMSISQRFDEPFNFTKEEFNTIIEIDRQNEKFAKHSGISNNDPLRCQGHIFLHMPSELLDTYKEDVFFAYLIVYDNDLKARLGDLIKEIPLSDILAVQENLKVKFPILNTYSPLVEKLVLDEKIVKSVRDEPDSSPHSPTFKL